MSERAEAAHAVALGHGEKLGRPDAYSLEHDLDPFPVDPVDRERPPQQGAR